MPLDPSKLRQLRQQRGMSQQALADAAGIPQPRISQIESGQRIHGIELQIVERLAQALHVPLPTLLHP